MVLHFKKSTIMFRKSHKHITDLTEMHEICSKAFDVTKIITKECTKLMFIKPLSYSQILHQCYMSKN